MKQEKQLLLDEIKEQIHSSQAFVVTQYSKLTAPKADNFRREIAKVGGHFEIVRKRMFIKAAQEYGITLDLGSLPGHVGVLFIKQDPIEATKAIVTYSEKNDNSFQLLAARVDGATIGAKDVERLATLPNKQEMRAQLLGLFEAPMAQTLAVFEALLSSIVYCLDNKANEQK